MQKIATIILAAGKSTRMKSKTPKVLHKILGKELLTIVIEKIDFDSQIFIVTSAENNDQIQSLNIVKNNNIQTIIQQEQLGTGHAVKIAMDYFSKNSLSFDKVIILYGDTPIVSKQTMLSAINSPNDITFVGFEDQNTQNQYGRFILNGSQLTDILEYKDINDEQKFKHKICNSGIVSANFSSLKQVINKITKNNKSSEYYLTDLPKICSSDGFLCGYIMCDKNEAVGVNNMNDISVVESIIQQSLRDNFMKNGVRLIEPSSVYFSFDTKIENDVTIEPNVIFKGHIDIKTGSTIKSFSYLEDVTIGSNCSVGPFCRIRGVTVIDSDCKIGNFVEIKNSILQNGVKAGHLAYIGDASVGKNSNIGAGAVTCNYDGINKHKTVIKDDVFIGSNASIIAPIVIESGSIIGAGSVITDEVPPNSISLSRSKQINIENAASRYRKKQISKKS